VVEANGGWIDKFEGDAALAIFGAPIEVEDAAGSTLTAARELGVEVSLRGRSRPTRLAALARARRHGVEPRCDAG